MPFRRFKKFNTALIGFIIIIISSRSSSSISSSRERLVFYFIFWFGIYLCYDYFG
jgi:hypothetical protein